MITVTITFPSIIEATRALARMNCTEEKIEAAAVIAVTEPTYEETKAAMMAYVRKHDAGAAQELVKSFGKAKLSELSGKERAELMKTLAKEGAA